MSILPKYAPPQGSIPDIQTMRRNAAELHEQGNAELMTTFKGTLEEKTVKTDAAGKKFIFNQ